MTQFRSLLLSAAATLVIALTITGGDTMVGEAKVVFSTVSDVTHWLTGVLKF